MPVIIIDEGPGSAASPPYNIDASGYQQQRVVDLSHFTTPQGWAKLAQIVLGIFVLCSGPPFWLSVVGWLALWGTVPWCWIYFFTINKRYAVNPPWIVLEFYYTAGVLVAYAVMTLITFITIVYVFSAICGLFATAAYAVGAYFLFIEWKAWRANPVNSATSVPK
ncbi:uncharacterized protein LOC110851610 [Folsomia candida]|uniref:MARVEL domain-containing protein n=1 Tax=Folsomia candida TaxID=158441 RepID=A0A226E1D3_FOLCA|nr:uncharacterized protein LOC110851610 [Folsomia candida]XP_035710043.1 uncharacterized protein LOC110851610 [Folsomia candida]OXA51532.1 hypothetical protein Fcan01_13620 [Folsomia candida]